MLVQFSHDKGCSKRFEVYSGGRRLESGEEYPLREGDVLELAEYNPAAGKWWFLRVFLAFLAGVLRGTFEDFSRIRCSRLRIRTVLESGDEELFIRFSEDGFRTEGAVLREVSREEEPLPKVKKRVLVYKISVIVLGLAALAAVLALLILL